ncbi:MAG TPA: adenylosuccinate lyase, partial [Deltaproteobacteria bacterium]|nr:adenylosuccinate lyase [Deltaproteobacteria bacterium]
MIKRYTRPEMGRIWELENKYRKWLDVEIAVCESMAELGLIPKDAAKEIREKADFNVDRIDEIEKETKHDVIAFLTNVAEYVGDAARYIHLGLTSSDILDTAFGLQLKEASAIIRNDLKQLLNTLKRLAFEHKKTVMIGRSHGI